MAYRVRARRAKVARYSIWDYILGPGPQPWTPEAYAALRHEVIRMYAGRLEIVEEFWAYEPGVPDWLRPELPRGDPRVWAFGIDSSKWRESQAAELAHEAVMVGRRAWLDARPGYGRDLS